MGESLGGVLRVFDREIVNFDEEDVIGKIPAIRMVMFDKYIKADDCGLEVLKKYDKLVVRGFGKLGPVFVEAFSGMLSGRAYIGGDRREAYIVA